ncbi:hypothetical protein Tco_0524331 [Tanacetum coccineum]
MWPPKRSAGQRQLGAICLSQHSLAMPEFTLLTKTPKEILAFDNGKFKPPPPMTTLVEKRNASKFSVTSNQRAEAKQWKRSGKGSQKGRNLQKGQATIDTDGTTMGEGSKTKDHSIFLSGISNLFSTSGGGRWDEGSHDY